MGVVYLQWYHSLTNIQIFKSRSVDFCASSHRFIVKKIGLFYLQKVGQGHGVQFSQLHHLMANVNIYKCLKHIFALAFTVSEIYNLKKKFLQNVGQCNGGET